MATAGSAGTDKALGATGITSGLVAAIAGSGANAMVAPKRLLSRVGFTAVSFRNEELVRRRNDAGACFVSNPGKQPTKSILVVMRKSHAAAKQARSIEVTTRRDLAASAI
jgi:hypothetical protein